MRFDFSGHKVIVTGGSKGIGRGIALAFVQAGAAVSICARDADALAAAAEEIAPFGTIHTAVCDLSDGDAVRCYVEQAAQTLGGIDVLVNNASGFGRSDDEAGWGAAVAVDLMGTLRAGWTALSWLEKSDNPSIVNISSNTVFKPSVVAPAYAAIKAALAHYTRSQAKALAKTGIRVNSVAPGSTEAPGHFFEQRKLAGDPSYARVLATMPAGRLGRPDEIADVVLFLASRAARWVNAQMIVADGGQHMFDNL